MRDAAEGRNGGERNPPDVITGARVCVCYDVGHSRTACVSQEVNMSISLPSALNAYLAVLVFCLGACIGSFVTCAADRYVAHSSVLRGRSHCPACGAALSAVDLVPILSFLFLRGKCRKCGAPIPPKCFFTELLSALVALATFLRYGFGFVTLEYLILFSILLAVALIDAETMEIPDGLILSGILLFALFLYPHGNSAARAKDALIGCIAIGGGILLLSLLLDFLLKKETLGGGDVKLLAMLALFTGTFRGLLLILSASLIGLFFFALRRNTRQKEFPFGPALSLSAVFVLLAGQEIIDLYLSLIL